MNDNQHMIFEESGCPAHQLLQDYLDGKLSGKEKHLIEKHLVDCEMCSDELEGLSLLKERGKLDMVVEYIKIKSLKKQSKILPFIYRYRIASAAAILIILAAIVIILQLSTDKKHQPLLAEKTEVVPEETRAKDKGESEAVSSEERDYEETSEELREAKKAVRSPAVIRIEPIEDVGKGTDAEDDIEEIVSRDIIEIDSESDDVVEISTPKSSKAKSGVYETKEHKDEKIAINEVAKTNEATKVEAAEINQIPVETDASKTALYTQSTSKKGARKSAEPNPMDKAFEKFNAEKYRPAARLFEEIIASDSTNFEAMYLTALCYYELKNYEKAIVYLGEIMSNEGNAYYGKAEKLLMDIKK
ncbi:MAG: zf-HC2 domain-containing protein [Bacteroidales bacterium]|nr:zf-HC2 domain-containing protein [Bacteroidales bacterium]